jgi:hypothetical protein
MITTTMIRVYFKDGYMKDLDKVMYIVFEHDGRISFFIEGQEPYRISWDDVATFSVRKTEDGT